MSHEVQGKPGSGTSGELEHLPAGLSRRDLRRAARARRRALTPSEQRRHGLAVARHLVASGLLAAGSRRVGLYLAADGELDLAPVLAHLVQTGATVALPQLDRRRGVMRLCRFRAGDALVVNRYGLLEPGADAPVLPVWTLSAVLLPLVAFDAAGHRLGMGGGYYDRLLGGALPRRPRLIGVAHGCQEAVAVPAEAWDVPLDEVITDAGRIVVDRPHHTGADRFEQLQSTLRISAEQLGDALGLSTAAQLSKPAPSQDLMDAYERLEHLLTRAVTLTGDQARGIAWLKTPAPALQGRRPLDLASTPEESDEVLALIDQLEHGIAP